MTARVKLKKSSSNNSSNNPDFHADIDKTINEITQHFDFVIWSVTKTVKSMKKRELKRHHKMKEPTEPSDREFHRRWIKLLENRIRILTKIEKRYHPPGNIGVITEIQLASK